jgi:hypothetical protein
MMNWKVSERKRSLPLLGDIPEFDWIDEENHEKFVKVARFRGEVRNRFLRIGIENFYHSKIFLPDVNRNPYIKSISFWVLLAVEIKIVVFWFVTACSLTGSYQWFQGNCGFHLQGRINFGNLLPIYTGLQPGD